MRQFFRQLFRFSLVGLILLFLIIVGYFYFDPFQVLYKHTDYSTSNFVECDRDYISTETYLNKKDIYHYNSFMFGSSRTMAYKPESWRKYLDQKAKIFAYDATMESIYGIYKKVKFLDSTGVNIKNALFIFCRDYTFSTTENPVNHILKKHPLLSGESRFDFQYTFFKSYFNINFLFSYYTRLLTGKHYPFMNEYLNELKVAFHPVSNHLMLVDAERMIRENPKKYYSKYKQKFYCKKDGKGILIQDIIIAENETVSENRIDSKMKNMLKEIHRILVKNKTNYLIILQPLLEKIKYSDTDYKILNSIFGNHIHDFTGKNKYTISFNNYYDWSHFRPKVGDEIFKEVYKK